MTFNHCHIHVSSILEVFSFGNTHILIQYTHMLNLHTCLSLLCQIILQNRLINGMSCWVNVSSGCRKNIAS